MKKNIIILSTLALALNAVSTDIYAEDNAMHKYHDHQHDKHQHKHEEMIKIKSTANNIEHLDCANTPIKAEYQVLNYQGEKLIGEYPLIIWRDSNHVAYQYPKLQLIDSWQRDPKNQLELSRYFVKHQRAIDYEFGDLKAIGNAHKWLTLYHLIDKSNMKKVSSSGEECQEVGHYKTKIANVEWLVKQQLPKQLVVNNKGQRQEYLLKKLVADKNLAKQFNVYRNYDATDFTDIGDNEADPFLSQMINMGFIEHAGEAVYDAEGNRASHAH